MSTRTAEVVEIDPTTGEPRLSHLVGPKSGVPGHVLILEARVNGTPLTALCGHVMVPSRDPRNYPDCTRCLAIFKATTGADDGYRDG